MYFSAILILDFLSGSIRGLIEVNVWGVLKNGCNVFRFPSILTVEKRTTFYYNHSLFYRFPVGPTLFPLFRLSILLVLETQEILILSGITP